MNLLLYFFGEVVNSNLYDSFLFDVGVFFSFLKIKQN